jgi:hypothetical protein
MSRITSADIDGVEEDINAEFPLLRLQVGRRYGYYAIDYDAGAGTVISGLTASEAYAALRCVCFALHENKKREERAKEART